MDPNRLSGLFNFNRILFEPIIITAIRQFHNLPRNTTKIIISGGTALSRYFDYPELDTSDYDLKLVVPKSFIGDPIPVLSEASDIFQQILMTLLNNSYSSIRSVIDRYYNAFGISLLYGSNNLPFITRSSYRLTSIVIPINIPASNETREVPFIDIWKSIPQETHAYNIFIGPIGNRGLIQNHQDIEYYIPTVEIHSVYYAGVGFVIWDTLRLIIRPLDLEIGTDKLVRYINKWAGIISALNHMTTNIYCEGFTPLIESCNTKFHIPTISNDIVNTYRKEVVTLSDQAIRNFIISNDFIAYNDQNILTLNGNNIRPTLLYFKDYLTRLISAYLRYTSPS